VPKGVTVISNELKNEIIEFLKPLNPHKIILFGSHAYGKPGKDSDIDLYVVTSDSFMPQTYKERAQLSLRTAQLLQDINKRYSIDVITHSRPMHQAFKDLDSMFCRKILQEGVVLYEENGG